ncbi:MAG: ATP-binding protein [Acidimicrobiia bacterium]
MGKEGSHWVNGVHVRGTAFSIDGRSFSLEAPLTEAVPIGAYVKITVDDDNVYLGQVLEESVGQVLETDRPGGGPTRLITGRGNLLAKLNASGSNRLDGSAVFGSGTVEAADADLVSVHLSSSLGSTVGIELGKIRQLPGVPATLNAAGFGRHTFLCGQSGSGKTYTLGIILERLLLDTDIKIAVADPNSDFVNLASLRPQSDLGLADDEYRLLSSRYETVASDIHVFGGSQSPMPLRAWFGRLTFEQQTMVLGLDPLAHAEEYNAYVRTVQRMPGSDYSLDDVLSEIRSSFDDDLRRLGLRIENLGVADLSIWVKAGEQAIRDLLPEDWRLAVFDLGSLPSRRESSIAAAALLGTLWEQRHSRQPILMVIDEAHNVCPQHPVDSNQALATEHVVRIAGEGRKYGLYLLLATQRPEKVHQNVLSQCDNLILMKMNSAADIRSLSETFSYTPAALVEQAAAFGLGEGLASGKIAPDPLLFKSGRRYTMEGGSDVSSTWASRRR